ncbi:hypothetical protein CTAYLR_008274 [Chrysophaeum taylorii]|uniref:Ferritin n=1 Tax=Chrysophaeum taylorii TaxID=2483200 RepID=A0AAD7UA97_9STRA|nr:hypothetical protein CTAYLR_008274 [Chrysophaeum taylorii]
MKLFLLLEVSFVVTRASALFENLRSDVVLTEVLEQKSRSRQNWHEESEALLNEHIALEFSAGYQYHALFAYAHRDTVNLKKSANFFSESAEEEFGHAQKLMEYQIMRGGVVDLKKFAPPVHEFPATSDKSDALVAFESVLAMEKKVYDSLLAVRAACGKHDDPQCQDYLDGFLDHQIRAVDQAARYVADLVRVGPSGFAVWKWVMT